MQRVLTGYCGIVLIQFAPLKPHEQTCLEFRLLGLFVSLCLFVPENENYVQVKAIRTPTYYTRPASIRVYNDSTIRQSQRYK